MKLVFRFSKGYSREGRIALQKRAKNWKDNFKLFPL